MLLDTGSPSPGVGGPFFVSCAAFRNAVREPRSRVATQLLLLVRSLLLSQYGRYARVYPLKGPTVVPCRLHDLFVVGFCRSWGLPSPGRCGVFG